MLGPDDHRAASDGDPVAMQRLSSARTMLTTAEVEARDGEVWVRGEQVSWEYRGQRSPRGEDGWFPTRDPGWIDEDGYLLIGGGADDTISRGGENDETLDGDERRDFVRQSLRSSKTPDLVCLTEARRVADTGKLLRRQVQAPLTASTEAR